MDNTSIRTAHPIYEDVLALLTAAGFVSLGIFLLACSLAVLPGWRCCCKR